MSLMKSLARVAAGVLVAKGLSKVMQGGNSANTRRTGGGILDQITRSVQGGRTGGQGGLGGLLGGILGGSTGESAGTRQNYGGPRSTGATGGLGGIFDQLTGATRGQTAGGLGGLIGGMLGGGLAAKGAQTSNDASFGELLNDSLARNDEPEIAPTAEQNATAGLMLRAMIQAAKADNIIDEAEKERLTSELGDLDEEERQFIREQMAAPVDAAGLARDVPKGLEAQVYMMSVMAIDFDSHEEARYLNELAQALSLQPEVINQIHAKIGVQNLYS